MHVSLLSRKMITHSSWSGCLLNIAILAWLHHGGFPDIAIGNELRVSDYIPHNTPAIAHVLGCENAKMILMSIAQKVYIILTWPISHFHGESLIVGCGYSLQAMHSIAQHDGQIVDCIL